MASLSVLEYRVAVHCLGRPGGNQKPGPIRSREAWSPIFPVTKTPLCAGYQALRALPAFELRRPSSNKRLNSFFEILAFE